jgi:energy-coupling factor transport system ATP-binding protein
LELPPDEVQRRAKTALEQVGLGHLWEHNTFNISKSLETLLGLASVLSLNPEVLILDEPTGGLDKKVGLRLMDSLEQVLKDETVIMITHDMALASRYAQRIIVLQNGKILIDGPTREVFSQAEILSQAMLQPPQITQLAQQLGNLGYPPDIMTTEEFIEMVGNQVPI